MVENPVLGLTWHTEIACGLMVINLYWHYFVASLILIFCGLACKPFQNLCNDSEGCRKWNTDSVQEEPHPAKDEEQKGDGYQFSTSAAYDAAISAASYVHSHMKGILSSRTSNAELDQELPLERAEGVDTVNLDMANFITATDSVTAVVAAEEEVKQALADDLKSKYSSPCEWFICDDDQSNTRFFVIQVR